MTAGARHPRSPIHRRAEWRTGLRLHLHDGRAARSPPRGRQLDLIDLEGTDPELVADTLVERAGSGVRPRPGHQRGGINDLVRHASQASGTRDPIGQLPDSRSGCGTL